MISISAPNVLPAWLQETEGILQEMVRAGAVFTDGQTLQMGWMWFTFLEVEGKLCLHGPEAGTMPFRMTRDCSEALTTVMMQKFVNESFGAALTECDACQSAILLKGLDRKDGLFMNRLEAANGSDSGWFIGAQRGDRDVNAPGNLERRSLWEISCLFPESLYFWMLPRSWQVVFADIPVVLADFQVKPALPGSLFALKYAGA